MRKFISLCVVLTVSLADADEQERLTVGLQPDGRIVVPTNQILKPAGMQVTFPGRPVDLVLLEDGKMLAVKNMSNLVFIDTGTGKIKQTLPSPAPFSVVGLLVMDEEIHVTDANDHVRVAVMKEDGTYGWGKSLKLDSPKVGGVAHPAGIARLPFSRTMAVTSTRGNNVQFMDSKVESVVPVGVAPFAVCFADQKKCYVSNWGGDHPGKEDPQALSSGTPTRIDPRTSIANSGTLAVLELDDKWSVKKSIKVGLHPSGMILSPKRKILYVANANSDTISVIATDKDEVVETISCRPESKLPFGSGCNALALSPDGRTLYAANGTNNCIAVIQLGVRARENAVEANLAPSKVLGLIPTGWYPGALCLSKDGKKLFVANIKGHGSLSQPRPVDKGKTSKDHLGSVSIIDVPDEAKLAEYTADVHRNNRLAYSIAGLEKPRPNVKPVPVPARHGEPSLIQHVIYVIKENRTYDQLFGDMKEGNGDPNLVIFGEKATPNHHALARQFTLFDNFYCSGVLSADGHQWINEAYVTDYLEKSFGKFTRSYPYEGSDPLAFASSGFLWDNALARKKTFRNYGEFVKSTYPRGTKWRDVYSAYEREVNFNIKVKANIASLEPHTRAGYPGFPLTTPDVYRARIFLEDLKAYEEKDDFPNLVYLFLPCDHTNGTNPGSPTPAAMVADNDLALGQIVEAVSKSKFWPTTCIFAVEDDPQAGFDHVDSHRTVALVISPYTKRRFVDHTNYNQTSMVKTIELMLGLPPMNQLDLSATALRDCFQSDADLTSYTCLPNNIPLDQMNPRLTKLTGKALKWAKKSMALNFQKEDEADEDTLNRILWHATRGYKTPYPARYAGVAEDDD